MTLTFDLLATLLALSAPAGARATDLAPSALVAPRPTAGLYAWMDPATGELRAPSDADLDAMRAELGLPDWDVEQALRTDSEDLVVEQDAFGVLSVDLQGRFQSAVFGRVEADGTTTILHDEPAGAPRPRP